MIRAFIAVIVAIAVPWASNGIAQTAEACGENRG